MTATPRFSPPDVTPAQLANALRMLAADAVEAAKSGHPGMPLGMAEIAEVVLLLFGESARKSVAWASAYSHSGMPTISQAWKAAVATPKARESASPMSSEAQMTRRRAMKRGSSPPSSIRKSQ